MTPKIRDISHCPPSSDLELIINTVEYFLETGDFGAEIRDDYIFCRLRTEDGARCAIGRLVPDEKYNGVLELQVGNFHLRGACELKQIIEPLNFSYEVIRRLQNFHDGAAGSKQLFAAKSVVKALKALDIKEPFHVELFIGTFDEIEQKEFEKFLPIT